MTRLPAVAAFFLVLAAAPLAGAQVAPAPASIRPAATDFSDADLKSFAVAVIEVGRINDNYLPLYQAARTPEEQALVEQKASEAMMQAVRDQGITVERYQEILRHAQTNPEIANRLDALIKEAASGSSSIGR